MKITELKRRDSVRLEALLTLWERSVRATHLFLSDAEIKSIRAYVPQALAGVAHLIVAEDADGTPVGFMGVQDSVLEMLFVEPAMRGCGVGRALLQSGIASYGVRRLAVNEQNPQAKGFYEHMGFRVCGRSELDEQGKPYPVLYMARMEAEQPCGPRRQDAEKRSGMGTEVFPFHSLKAYKYVVILSHMDGKYLLSRHKARTTWETQGGHIELGETALEAAKRELWEESGALEYTIEPLCDYRAADDLGSAAGAVFRAEIVKLGPLPESEMAEVRLFEALPENLTYPHIASVLFAYEAERYPGGGARTEGQ